MEEIQQKILDKKIDSYYSNNNDFKGIDELTVEITLNEYRYLIQEISTKKYDIEKAEKDKYTRQSENEKMKNKIKEYETLILKYKCRFGELPEEEEDE